MWRESKPQRTMWPKENVSVVLPQLIIEAMGVKKNHDSRYIQIISIKSGSKESMYAVLHQWIK